MFCSCDQFIVTSCDPKRLCICVKRVFVKFFYVCMANDDEEFHVVLQAFRFDLDEIDEMPSSQPFAKVLGKEK